MELTAIKAWLLSVYPESLLKRIKKLSVNSEQLNYRRDKIFLEVELPIKLDKLITITRRIKKHKLENELKDKINIINEIFKEAESKINLFEAHLNTK